MNNQAKSSKLGLIGTVIGLVALGIAVFHFFFGPIESPPPIENVVAETTAKLKEAITTKLQGGEYEAPGQEKKLGPDKIVEYLTITLGFRGYRVRRHEFCSAGSVATQRNGVCSWCWCNNVSVCSSISWSDFGHHCYRVHCEYAAH